jgi:hypothetical protein
MSDIPNDDESGFVSEEPEHSHACLPKLRPSKAQPCPTPPCIGEP